MSKQKIKLFIDADDTTLASSKTIIDLLNKKYEIIPPKGLKDLKDWGYRSIYKNLSRQQVEEMFESDDFFSSVEVVDGFANFYKEHGDKFSITVVTAGTKNNLTKKQEYFHHAFGDSIKYVGIETKYDEFGELIWDYDKSSVDMRKSVHIDDRIDALRSTNASVKILLKNGDYYWNEPEAYANIDNLYVCNNWDEITQILLFAYERCVAKHKEKE